MARLSPLLLVMLLAGCIMRQPVADLRPAEPRSLLTSPAGPGAGRTTVGEMLEPARAGAPAASPDVQRGPR